jgi:hypothetical protein
MICRFLKQPSPVWEPILIMIIIIMILTQVKRAGSFGMLISSKGLKSTPTVRTLRHAYIHQKAAKPGVGTYPYYTDNDFIPPRTGWVIQNGATPQAARIWISCEITPTSCYFFSFENDGSYYKIKSEWFGLRFSAYLQGPATEADLLATAVNPYSVTWTSSSSGNHILWEFERVN